MWVDASVFIFMCVFDFAHPFISVQEMCDIIDKLKGQLKGKQAKIKDLEDYIDSLVLRVLDRNPSILNMAPGTAGSSGGSSATARHNGVFAM